MKKQYETLNVHSCTESRIIRNPLRTIFKETMIYLLALIIVCAMGVQAQAKAQFPADAQAPAIHAATHQAGSKTRAIKAFSRLPLIFEENRGQVAHEIKYMAQGRGYRIFFVPSGAVMALSGADGKARSMAMHLNFSGAAAETMIKGSHLLPGKSNYFRGNDPKKWLTDVPQYARVEYKEIYHGINAVFYGHDGELEFDLELSAGARPQDIRLALSGAERVRLDKIGNLHMESGDGEMIVRKPVIYQRIKGKRQFVQGGFILLKSTSEKTEVGFQLAKFDTAHTLIIDPAVSWSTYLGGGANITLGTPLFDGIAGAAVDGNGNVYVTGKTQVSDFPTVIPFQANLNGSWEAFVSKISADGTTLLYSTYLDGTLGNGNLFSEGLDVAVDANGNAYVTGRTSAKDFPVTAGAAQTAFGGGFAIAPPLNGTADAFVAKLNATGNALAYATYIGGSDSDSANRIALASNGFAYVVGSTKSNNLPSGLGGVIQAQNVSKKDAQQRFKNDVFVAVVDAAGATFPFITYLGGGADDFGVAIALDSLGRIAITGYTASSINNAGLNPTPFPTTANAFDTVGKVVSMVTSDAFVALINPDMANLAANPALLYSTYFGGSGSEQPFGEISDEMGLAVDANNMIYVAGNTATLNNVFDFPVTAGAFQVLQKGGMDAFVAKFNPAGNGTASLIYATLLGGVSAFDPALDLAVDDQGRAIVVGETFSKDFPIVNPLVFPVVAPFNTQPPAAPATPGTPGQFNGALFNQGLPDPVPVVGGLSDAYVTQLNATGTALVFSTFLGGSGFDMASAIVLDRPRGAVIVAGHTHAFDPAGVTSTPGVTGTPGAWDFPTTAGVFQAHSAGDPGELIHATLKGGTSDAFITKMIGIISPPAPPVPPTFTASLNASVFTMGQALTLSVAVTAGSPSVQADAYVVLQLPDGTLLYMQPGGGFSTTRAPLLSGWRVSTLSIPLFFNYTFRGAGVEPIGSYTWFVGLANPGTLNFIGAINAVPFTVN